MDAGKYLAAQSLAAHSLVALTATLAALPAYGQQASPTPAPSARPVAPVTIPAIIPERFSIGGTPTVVPTAAPTPAPTPTAAAPRPVASATPRAFTPVSRVTPIPVAQPSAGAPVAPVPRPTETPVTLPPAAVQPPLPAAPIGYPPWLWALLGAGATVLAGGAGWALLRGRGKADAIAPAPVAPPAPRPVPNPAAPAKPAASGDPFDIVVRPLRIEIGEREILIDAEIAVINAGGAPAEGVRLSAAPISASPRQDADIASWFAAAQFAGSSPPFDLPPGEGGTMPIQLRLPREAVHVVDLGGQPMFVPIVAVSLRWLAGLSIRRFGASFMLGGAGQGGKPSPVWLNRGQPRGAFAATRYLPRA